jgi:hypothetical protein
MQKRKLLLILPIVLLAVVFSAAIAAASIPESGPVPQANALTGPPSGSPHYQLDWNIAATGGGTVSSSHFQISATVGQPATGISSSSNFEVCSGFWCKILAFFELYLPIQVKN